MTNEATNGEPNFCLLGAGPLHSLLARAGITRPGMAGVASRVVVLIAVTWIPLLVLSLFQGVAVNPGITMPFLYDFFSAARFLLVGPLLIASEAMAEPWLIHTVRQFRDSLVPEQELPRFHAFIASALRWRDSYMIEILLFVCAFGIQIWNPPAVLPPSVSTWQTHMVAQTAEPTMASIWDSLVASPLIRFLWLRWMWKYIIWSTLLCRVASLPLKLAAIHPDRAGGLGFLAFGQVKLAVLSLAFSIQVASFIGEEIAFAGMPIATFRDEIIGTAILNLLIFLTPLLAFSPKLLACKRIGLFEYGELADRYANAFQEKWIGGRGAKQEELLGNADVQSLSDLRNSFAVVEEMRTVLINKETVLVFLLCSLAPFSPLLLAHYPLDELLKRLLETFL